jgi:two-component system nitrogen regulation response regulator GlnG
LQRLEPSAAPLQNQTECYLKSLPWLGNVRELRHALEHAAIVARGGPLLPEHFPPQIARPAGRSLTDRLAATVRDWLGERIGDSRPGSPENLYEELLRCVEPALLEEVMRQVQGNRWVAAQWLGLNRATVRKKLALYNLTDAHRHR